MKTIAEFFCMIYYGIDNLIDSCRSGKCPFVYKVRTLHIIGENILEDGRTIKLFAFNQNEAWLKIIQTCQDDEVITEIDGFFGGIYFTFPMIPASYFDRIGHERF